MLSLNPYSQYLPHNYFFQREAPDCPYLIIIMGDSFPAFSARNCLPPYSSYWALTCSSVYGPKVSFWEKWTNCSILLAGQLGQYISRLSGKNDRLSGPSEKSDTAEWPYKPCVFHCINHFYLTRLILRRDQYCNE